MSIVETHSCARAGFLGNPSDIYQGQGVGFAIADFTATVTLEDASDFELPNELFEAGWRFFVERMEQANRDPRERPFALGYRCEIPYQSGLSGSTALLVAAIRGWSEWYGLPLSHLHVAETAYQAETIGLTIRAGPLDRLVLAHQGLLAMDFSRPFQPESVERLDPELLPQLLLAWDPEPGVASGDVHEPIWRRFVEGHSKVRAIMGQLIEVGASAAPALCAQNRELLLRLIDRNFNLRASLFPIGERDMRMITLGRSLGAATKFCGSGGSVLAMPHSPEGLDELRAAYEARGFPAIVPRVAEPLADPPEYKWAGDG